MSELIVTVTIDCDYLPSPDDCERVAEEIEDAANGAMIQHESYAVSVAWAPKI